MAALEFEALLEDGVIHVPDDIAARLSKHTPVRVSITTVDQGTTISPDAAWDTIMAFVRQRMASTTPVTAYHWRREDAYKHLDDPESAD